MLVQVTLVPVLILSGTGEKSQFVALEQLPVSKIFAAVPGVVVVLNTPPK